MNELATEESSCRASVPVSVVIPCYRCAGTIGRAITSVVAQTARPVEVLLIDDGSEDETMAMLHRTASEHPPGWIRILALPSNQGPAAARNAGWEAAIGDFVAFLDADDAWDHNKLALQYAFMRANSEVALSGHAHRVLRASDSAPSLEPPTQGWQQMTSRMFLLSNRFVTPSVMVRRSLPYRFRLESRHMEDALLWQEIVLDGHQVARLDAKLAILFKRPWRDSGLSAALLAMEKAELANYALLARTARISWTTASALMVWSFAKFMRRVLIAGLRRSVSDSS